MLFSVYPDNFHLGEQLGKIARTCITQGCNGEFYVEALTAIKTAINKRTFSRLDLDVDLHNTEYVNIVFPVK